MSFRDELGFPALGYHPAHFFLSVFQRGNCPLGAAGLVFCIIGEEKQVEKKNQNKLPFTWLLHGIGLSAGHQCFSEVLFILLSSDQFSAFDCDVSAGNPLICLEQHPQLICSSTC